MRTASAAMQTMLAGRFHTRANCLLLDLKDGTSIAITDHDADIDFDIGDGTVTYAANTGISVSNIAMACGLDSDNYEVRGPVGDVVTLAGLLGGKYNRARARLFQVNWASLTDGALKFPYGYVGEARVEGGEFVFEVRSDVDRLNQTIGRIVQNQCDADYADQVRCFAVATDIVGTVTAVTDAMRFTVSFTGTYATGFFNRGKVIGLTGVNADAVAPIETWTGTGAIVLFMPLVTVPAVGDTFTVRDGCARTREACMAHDAILWFRGYPEVPGMQALKPAIPAQGSDTGGKGK